MLIKGGDIRSKAWYKTLDTKIIKAILDVMTTRQPKKIELFISPRGKEDCILNCWIAPEEKIEITANSDDGVS